MGSSICGFGRVTATDQDGCVALGQNARCTTLGGDDSQGEEVVRSTNTSAAGARCTASGLTEVVQGGPDQEPRFVEDPVDELEGRLSAASSGSGGIDGVDSDGDYDIHYFRFKDKLPFDSSDDDMEDLQQEEIDF